MEEGGGESFWRNENRRENTVEYVRGRSSRQHSERWWNIWGDASALCRNEDTSPEKAILLHIKKQLQEPSIFPDFVFFFWLNTKNATIFIYFAQNVLKNALLLIEELT